MKELLILGFGGHARSVADVAVVCGYDELVFLDAKAKDDEKFLGFAVVKTVPQKAWRCILAAGDNLRRSQQMQEALEMGWTIETLISPHSTQGIGSQIGKGCFLAHHSHVGPMAVVKEGGILNTGAIVEHECCIGEFSHVSVNATLGGQVVLGHHVFVGAGAVIRNNVTITDHVIIGAGATVVSDITEAGVYIGTPAKHQKSTSSRTQ